MIKKIVLMLLLCAPAVFAQTKAQTTTHGINVSGTDTTTVQSFNLYRGTAPGGEILYQSGIVGTTSFTYLDTNGTGGTRYYYTATAVLNGIESAQSAEVSAVFPIIPAPPVITVVPQ